MRRNGKSIITITKMSPIFIILLLCILNFNLMSMYFLLENKKYKQKKTEDYFNKIQSFRNDFIIYKNLEEKNIQKLVNKYQLKEDDVAIVRLYMSKRKFVKAKNILEAKEKISSEQLWYLAIANYKLNKINTTLCNLKQLEYINKEYAPLYLLRGCCYKMLQKGKLAQNNFEKANKFSKINDQCNLISKIFLLHFQDHPNDEMIENIVSLLNSKEIPWYYEYIIESDIDIYQKVYQISITDDMKYVNSYNSVIYLILTRDIIEVSNSYSSNPNAIYFAELSAIVNPMEYRSYQKLYQLYYTRYFRKDRPKKLIYYIDKAIECNNFDPDLYLERGNLYNELGNPGFALRNYYYAGINNSKYSKIYTQYKKILKEELKGKEVE